LLSFRIQQPSVSSMRMIFHIYCEQQVSGAGSRVTGSRAGNGRDATKAPPHSRLPAEFRHCGRGWVRVLRTAQLSCPTHVAALGDAVSWGCVRGHNGSARTLDGPSGWWGCCTFALCGSCIASRSLPLTSAPDRYRRRAAWRGHPQAAEWDRCWPFGAISRCRVIPPTFVGRRCSVAFGVLPFETDSLSY
jgi:hypothetical protein